MRRRNRWRTALIFGLTGWLFADLFIALTMGFVANIVGYQSTPTPIPPTITPTIPPAPALDLTPVSLTLTINAQGILDGDKTAIASVEQQIKSNPALTCKRAGLVLTFGGAPSSNDTGTALRIARNIDSRVFMDLGNQGFVFDIAVYRPFFNLGTSPNTINADVYVFKNISSC
ncbi:MAG TPA: hypothetical protein VFX24_11665 [Ktedonobacterales bacterium]|jgi:hypothetical protein|nr:hypothetical protein [Ktedonobacterales bacterium]